MPDIALYYPYTHVRDDAWLKAAALYLPKLALLTPPGYPFRLSHTAEVLRGELGFLVGADPSQRAHGMATEFLELLNRNASALAAKYAWQAFPEEFHQIVGPDGDRCYTPESEVVHGDHRVEWIHVGKVSPELLNGLIEAKLGIANANRMWVALHPRLGAVYLAALANRVARANRMPVVTDQAQSYGALNGWEIDTLARVLLADEDDHCPPTRPAEEISAVYAALAIQAVVPAGLESLPVERIVQTRRKLAPEFDAFCGYLDSLSTQFAEFEQIEDPAVLSARLEIMLGRDLLRPIEDLKRGLRRLGFQPAGAVLAMKTLELPAVAAAAASGIALPAAAGQAGMAAAQLIAAGVHARQAAEQSRRSAAGYLLGLRGQLSPTGVLYRLRQTFDRASSW